MSPGALGAQPHPSQLSAARPSAFGYVSQGRVRRLATMLLVFVLITLAAIASALVDLAVWVAVEHAGTLADADASMMALRGWVVQVLYVLALVGAALVFGRFLVQANRNAAFLGTGTPTLAPSSMVLWFFVPIACLWRPYVAVRELWSMSTPRRGSSDARRSVLPMWWSAWVAGLLLAVVAVQRAQLADTPAEHGEAVVFDVAAKLALVLAAVFAASWTRALSQRQDDTRAEHVCDLAALR
jgi:hypothetical protein